MRKLLFIMLLFIAFFYSCDKEDDSTRLEITLLDESSNPVKDASVWLYSSESDWRNKTNAVSAVYYASDSDGRVIFFDLDSRKYYWHAEKGCLNNANSGVSTSSNLTVGVKNTVNTTMLPTGSLLLENNSNNPYRIFVNGEAITDISGRKKKTIDYIRTGSINVRVLQQSGYLIYPTDKTYSGTLECGETLRVAFP